MLAFAASQKTGIKYKKYVRIILSVTIIPLHLLLIYGSAQA